MTDIRLSLLRNKHRASDYAPLPDNSTSTSRAGSRMLANMKRRYSRDNDSDEGAHLLADEEATEERIEIGPIHTSSSPAPPSKSKGARTFTPGTPHPCTPNVVRNQKYTPITFLPVVLYEQFKFFFNLYFLLVALSQFVPALKIGFIATYVAPLAFVLAVTVGKEAWDDWLRVKRDREANGARYVLLDTTTTAGTGSYSDREETLFDAEGGLGDEAPTRVVASSALRVGDLVLLEKNTRVPADMLLLRTRDSSGTCFVRTDQLDGETDWKLRVAVPSTQSLPSDKKLLAYVKGEGENDGRVEVYAAAPSKDIHTFVGTFRVGEREEPLGAENMLWANTVLAAGSVIGCVVYTGPETRAVMNTSHPKTKVGLLDMEINALAKILCAVTFALSLALVALNGFRGPWWIYVFRFLILFSSIIPISLRVNLDMGKTFYARAIEHDNAIPGTIVRTSTLPEELGRVEYLLSDKTGTLTQNEMEMKKLHMGTMAFGSDAMDEVAQRLDAAFQSQSQSHNRHQSQSVTSPTKQAEFGLGMGMAGAGRRRDMSARVRDVVLALALCHNVTPVLNDDGSTTYQASSPDEVAIVQWTESVGLTLTHRDRTSMTLTTASGYTLHYTILHVFPFTSESKRMGIVVRSTSSPPSHPPPPQTSSAASLIDDEGWGSSASDAKGGSGEGEGEVLFLQKGADAVMARIVGRNDWLDEECANFAREGLRTLVVGRRRMGRGEYGAFEQAYRAASVATDARSEKMAGVVAQYLERDLELLGLTGVEDKLQEDVRGTIESLRNAGIRVWMLTGDKVETATVIANSTRLVRRGGWVRQVVKLRDADDVRRELDFLQSKTDCTLVIDGESLQLCMDLFLTEFIAITTKLPAVVACRCSPTQKADVARAIRAHTKARVACIGDGGNDVSMIQAADVGIGIVGKEGKQASLAADFSLTQFSHLTKLLLWHGRNSYRRSAKLAQFVIHRGLIISVMQAVFSSIFYFAPIALYQGWLMVGYATVYTMAPVFSLVLDRDVSEDVALGYPELYKELTKGRALSYKTFFMWLFVSLYQGSAIMLASLALFETEFLNVVAISFSALIFNELIMVALEVTIWHRWMIISLVATACIYAGSMFLLPEYFDLAFVLSTRFLWKVAVIVAVSAAPLWIYKLVHSRVAPAASSKLL
ncbi:phospholipid-translocating P-type ATPase [Peniophora sp. CONT]|nr:phospholipid-translocating P-type ATPase [Peniophora sp. CONT]